MMVSKKTPETIYLNDYTTPAWLIDHIGLDFDLHDSATQVRSVLSLYLNPDRAGRLEPVILAGEQLQLLEVKRNGIVLRAEEYQLDEVNLQLEVSDDKVNLEITTQIDPLHNTALEGLYLTNGNFCTQCEAEGFRRITYYPDRPDVLAQFRVRIEADKKYRVLLSNGQLLEQGDASGNRHFAVWEDPFCKPSYLFALVAGDLVCLEDHFTTISGRDVLLQIYVEEQNRNDCDHAMVSLKKSMRWDEEVFGLEYDLDRFMIVAVDDFNMGAMENKGLNIFNSKYVLARPETATDSDYLGIESVIAHEYFHNWTGNRVTCRDWFQLSLKEGLTVFRDQQFSADMNSSAVQRIDDVRILRQFQFPEDAGPMAHPVRPESYQEINNFYTTTIYNKGAEVIRMMQTLLGREKFIAGVQLYLQRHDGQAVTCDDFVTAMEDAGTIDLTVFQRWYSQAGTPQVKVERRYDADRQTFTVKFEQSCPATPGQEKKEPFHIPVVFGLLDSDGNDIPLQFLGEDCPGETTRVLELTDRVHEFTFVGLTEAPTISPLRGFSAPVVLQYDFTTAELAFRMAFDNDPFNRWEAGQVLATQELLRMYHACQRGEPGLLGKEFVSAWQQALDDQRADPGSLAQLLTLPSEQYLADQLDMVDPQKLRDIRDRALLQLAEQHKSLLLEHYHRYFQVANEYSLEPQAVGCRSLGTLCLSLLQKLETADVTELSLHQYRSATNMTDRLAAFSALVDSCVAERRDVIDDFYQQWHGFPLLLDKWFTIQALSHCPDTFTAVETLLQHADFSLNHPNRVRALLGAFYQNLAVFHRSDGSGYRLLVDQILQLDSRNPQVAARMAAPLVRWQRFEPQRRKLMEEQLRRLQQAELSNDLYEIVDKSLK